MSTLQSFTIVFVPANESCAIEERVLTASSIDEQVSMVTSHAKAHFTRVADMDALSDAQKAVHQAKMLETVRKNNPNAAVSADQLAMLSTMNLVDTIPLIGASAAVRSCSEHVDAIVFYAASFYAHTSQ